MNTLYLIKEEKIYNGEKTISLASDAGQTDQPTRCKRMKLEHFLTPYTKIKSKWTKNSKCKTRNYKALRGKHRQNNLWHKSQQAPLQPTSKSNGNKNKYKQMGHN